MSRSKRRVVAALTCFGLLACLGLLAAFIAVPQFANAPREYWKFRIRTILLGVDTRYAPGFSPSNWEKVKIGDSEGVLYAHFGKPLLVAPKKTIETWVYEEEGLVLELDSIDGLGGKRVKAQRWSGQVPKDSMDYVGKSNVDVLSSLGEPTEKLYKDDFILLWYSTPEGGLGEGDYIQFIVYLEPKSRTVYSKVFDYYVD